MLQVWLTDKDAAEKSAIREQFPHSEQFLCTFHVLQAFRRGVQPILRGDAKERDRVLRVLQKLPYANSEEEYWRIREEVGHAGTEEYLQAN